MDWLDGITAFKFPNFDNSSLRIEEDNDSSMQNYIKKQQKYIPTMQHKHRRNI